MTWSAGVYPFFWDVEVDRAWSFEIDGEIEEIESPWEVNRSRSDPTLADYLLAEIGMIAATHSSAPTTRV